MFASSAVLVSSGEPSGERAATRVISALTAHGIERFFGIGGRLMKNAGVELVSNFDSMTALGIADSFRNFGLWTKAWANLRERIAIDRPIAALLVDSPEFHLPLARVLKSAGVPVIWYIGPQLWAWRKHRLSLLKERTDSIALILPFEKALYDSAGIQAQYVGHPLLDEPAPKARALVRRILCRSNEDKIIALLPGSRPAEISRHLRPMKAAAQLLMEKGFVPIIAPGGAFDVAHFSSSNGALFLPRGLSALDLLSASDAAVVASGTATLEAALLRVPEVVVYRTDSISYFIGKHILSLPYIALPNWILGENALPELLQHEMTPENLFREATRLLDPDVASSQRAAFDRISAAVGSPGAAEKVAAMVLDHIQ